MAIEITDANIKALLAEGKPLVVDLWAPWCGPCKMMLPIVEELSNEYEGRVVVGKLNVDDNPDTCEEYGIMNIPTMLFFKNGEWNWFFIKIFQQFIFIFCNHGFLLTFLILLITNIAYFNAFINERVSM